MPYPIDGSGDFVCLEKKYGRYCAVLFHDLLLCIRPGIGERKATTYAILVSLYSVHWFFTFLYYTDVASLAAGLAMYLFCLKKQFWISAMTSERP
ncbi:unnamed protein product [Urochloa humidicola]